MEMNILRFLRWMARRDWPTYLYARPGSDLYEHAAGTEVQVRPVNTTTRHGGPANTFRLARAISEDHLAVMTIHQGRDILMGILAQKFSRAHSKLIFHQHMYIGGTKRDLIHAWEYRRFDAFVTPIPSLARQALQKTVVPEDRIHIIPRGIELKHYTYERPSKVEARRKLDIPIDRPLVGIIGRLDPQKGQVVVIRALRRVLDAGAELSLVLVGAKTKGEETGYKAEVHRLITELHLENRVYIRDYIPETEFAFAALDYFVLASQSETYGMVTIEAMASRLPVIGTSSGGTVDLIHHESNGLLFPPGNDQELAACLLRYLRDPAFADQMAAKAEADAIERFPHEKQCAAWESLIRSLLVTR
jgi:glycosyltransferase involved in cell wall biosynthesis